MTTAEILTELEARGGQIVWQNERLFITPKSVLDDGLRAAMRQNRAELETYAQNGTQGFLGEVLQEFGGTVIKTWENESLEELPLHIPATFVPPCTGYPRVCRTFSEKQLWGYTSGDLSKRVRKDKVGCGDCLEVHTQMRLDKNERERQEAIAKEKAQERNNWRMMQQEENDE